MNWAAFFATTSCLLLGWVAYQREGVKLERVLRLAAEDSRRRLKDEAGDLRQRVSEVERAGLRVTQERDRAVAEVVALRAENDQLRAELAGRLS